MFINYNLPGTIDKVRLDQVIDDEAANAAADAAHLADNAIHLTIDKLRTATLYNQAIEQTSTDIPFTSLAQAHKAINNGFLNVAFWGDSITEGLDQIDSREAYVNRFINELKKVIPNVNITSQNFGLGSRGISQAYDTNYLAVNPEPTDITQGFWRSWATVGKSWRDHIKDFAPDLLIIAFGMNDARWAGSDDGEYIYLKGLVDYCASWAKVPSIVLVPTILPTTNTSRYPQRQDVTNAVARTTREFGRNNGYPVADANRLFQILRDSNDQVLRAGVGVYSPTTGWTGDTADYVFTSGQISQSTTSGNKFVTQSRTFYNGVIETDITPITNGAYSGQIRYRVSDLGHMLIQISSGDGSGVVQLYSSGSGSPLVSVGDLSIPAGIKTHIKVEVDGANHKVYVGNTTTPTLEYTNYGMLHDGGISIGNSVGQMSTLNDFKVVYADPLNGGKALYTEDDLLGVYNDPLQSGNGINHPSGQGTALFYLPAFYGVLKKLSKPSGITIGKILGSLAWGALGVDWVTTTTAGETLYYIAFPNTRYDKNLGVALKRLDTNQYYGLSTTAINKSTLVNLEPGRFAYFRSPDVSTTDLIFVSVPGSGGVTWDFDMLKLM